MRKSHWSFCLLLVGACVFVRSGIAAEISWSAAFEIETDADIDVDKEIVRAVNVADPNAVEEFEVEFPNGKTVEFEPEHTFEFNVDLDEDFGSGGNVTADGTFYTEGGLTTENEDLDRVLNSHGWAGGGPGAAAAVLELSELTVAPLIRFNWLVRRTTAAAVNLDKCKSIRMISTIRLRLQMAKTYGLVAAMTSIKTENADLAP
jgi:hypothetical protein